MTERDKVDLKKVGKIAGMGKLGLLAREERVVSLAIDFDNLNNKRTTKEQWHQHYLDCLAKECPDMAKRALRKKEEAVDK